MNRLTIVLPIREPENTIAYLMPLQLYLSVYPTIIVKEFTLSEARKYGISKVETEYTLNLDLDNILPEGYIEKAIEILDNNPMVMMVALDYDIIQGHLAFGTSIWRTKFLQANYDWNSDRKVMVHCECIHMMKKVRGKGYLIETLPIRAKHLRRKKV
jgi:hypothetical protein